MDSKDNAPGTHFSLDKSSTGEAYRFLEKAPDIFLSEVLVNAVIFSFYDDRLEVLLLRLKDTDYCALPGRYIIKNESIDDASQRLLQQYVRLKTIFQEQFYTSGEFREEGEDIFTEILKRSGLTPPDNNWLSCRKVLVCYYSCVDRLKVILTRQDIFVEELFWADVRKLPKLISGHNDIIKKAVIKLQDDMDKRPVAYNLLNKTFTLNELQSLHETIFQKKFTKSNFQRKILCSNTLVRLEKLYDGRSHKAPYLYRFKSKKR